MVKVGHDYSGRTAPDWFLRDLKLISPNFSVLWDRFHHKWLVVSPAPLNVFRSGYVVERVIERDRRFYPLNSTVLEALAKSMTEKRNFTSLDGFIKGVEREHAEKGDKAEIKRLEMQREFEKEWYKLQHNKTVS